MILREMEKARRKKEIRDEILNKNFVKKNFFYDVDDDCELRERGVSEYFLKYPINLKFPKVEIGKNEILRVEKNSDKILNEIKFLFGNAGVKVKKKFSEKKNGKMSLMPIIKKRNSLGRQKDDKGGVKKELNLVENGKIFVKKKNIFLGNEDDDLGCRLEKIYRELEFKVGAENLVNRIKENFHSLQTAYNTLEIMQMSGFYQKKSTTRKVTIEELDFDDKKKIFNFGFKDVIEEQERGKLIHFVAKLEKFPSLKFLLDKIPQDLKISKLECTHNEIKSIFPQDKQSDEIENKKILEEIIDIDVSNNFFNSINEFEIFNRLCFLNCSNNKIIDLPHKELKFLKALNIPNNNIASLENIHNISSLRILNISANHITKIKNIEKLTFLEKLDLSRNRIKKLENLNENIFLQTLILYGNEINEIESTFEVYSLEELHLSDNRLDSLETNWKCPNLKILNLKNNSLNFIKKECLYFFENLEILDLAFNPISVENFDILIKHTPNLRVLDYYGEKNSSKDKILSLIQKRLKFLKKLNDEDFNPIFEIESDLEGVGLKRDPENEFLGFEKKGKFFNMHKKFMYLKERFRELEMFVRPYTGMGLKEISINPDFGFLVRQEAKIAPLLFMSHFYIFKSMFDRTEAKVENVLKVKKNFFEKNLSCVEKVKRSLKDYVVRKKKRREHFLRSLDKIVKIQKVFRGYRVRRENSDKSNWKMAKMRAIANINIEKLIKIQSLVRGFITRRRFNRMFKDLKFEVETDLADSEVENFFDTDLDLEKGLNLPSDLMNFFENGLTFPTQIQAPAEIEQEDELLSSHSSQNSHQSSKRSFRIGNIKIDSDRESLASRTDNSDSVSVLTLESKLDSRSKKLPKLKVKKKKKPVNPPKRTLEIIEEWGFKNQAAKRALEHKLAKERRRKKKAKKLTASERFRKFQKKAQRG